MEWNLQLNDEELDELAGVITLHRRLRPLLCSGDVVRFDTGPAHVAHGVYAPDRSEAVVSFAAVATSLGLTPLRLQLAVLGIQLPALHPETAVVLHLTARGRPLGVERLSDGAADRCGPRRWLQPRCGP